MIDLLENPDRLVSVIIPAHNASPFIKETIWSVLKQTHKCIEILVVEDSSTDDTFDQISSVEEPRLRVFKKKFANAARSRNFGLSQSCGNFILFLDADDLVSEQHIEFLLKACEAEKNIIAMGQWDRFDVSPCQATFPMRPTYLNCSGLEWLLLDWSFGQPMTQCGSFLIPRPLIDRVGGWDERLSLIDDFEFFTRILIESAGVRFVYQARLFYRSNVSGSLSGRRNRRAAESAFLSLILGVERMLSCETSQRTRSASANVLQTFEYAFFPRYLDLIFKMRKRISDLGGAGIEPVGPPRFHMLRRFIGWRLARIVQISLGR